MTEKPEECELLRDCGFFKKYQAAKDLACKGLIRLYCRGSRMEQCKRKQSRAEHGAPPSDDMLPSGYTIVAASDKAAESTVATLASSKPPAPAPTPPPTPSRGETAPRPPEP